MGEWGAVDDGDGGGWVEGSAGAPAQRAAPIRRALVLEPPLPPAGGRVFQPGQLEGQPGLEGDLDQPTRAAPPWVVVLADAADEVVGPVLDLPRVRWDMEVVLSRAVAAQVACSMGSSASAGFLTSNWDS